MAERSSYRQILKSSVIIGGSSFAGIAFTVIRTKCVAVLLGTTGIGLMAIFNSLLELAQGILSFGINSSAVREIAASQDCARRSQTAYITRRLSLICAILGCLVYLLNTASITQVSFGTTAQQGGVALLAVAVLFRVLAAVETAVLQGMRMVAEVAISSIGAGALGMLVTIPIVYLYGENGIVPSIVLTALVAFVCPFHFSRRLTLSAERPSSSRFRTEAVNLMKLGVVFMATALLSLGAAYVIRALILRRLGIDAAGVYQSAWALGGLYVGFILQAMGSDFYPRLTASIESPVEANRIVNEQAHISMLLAGPGIVSTLTFAPLVVAAFYSAEFLSAIEVLRWIALGMMLRVIAWPMGFIVVAKGARLTFLFTELAATIVHVGVAWVLMPYLGVVGCGIAFCILYLWHSAVIYVVVRKMTGFRWSMANARIAAGYVCVAGALLAVSYFISNLALAIIGFIAVAFTGWHSFSSITRLIPAHRVPLIVKRFLPANIFARA